ncbi:MAG: hypothetical protein FWG40_09900 [Peptococcaceae bacterium]|nr:hypothetical protein [Peptococcaceae bacterium]
MNKSLSKQAKVYLISLGAVLLASAYPLYMGTVMLAAYFRDGGINVTQYPKYIIPYTPICLALILCVALLPLAFRYCKKYTLLVVSILAILLFVGAELAFEKVTIFSGAADDRQAIVFSEKPDDDNHSAFYWFKVALINESGETETRIVKLDKNETDQKVETWQWALCMARPIDMPELARIQIVSADITDGEIIDIQEIPNDRAADEQLIEEQFEARSIFKNPYITKYSPVFKIHFYIISVIIDLVILGVVYGFYRTARDENYRKKKPLIVQLVSVGVFVGLCIFACFTAFYRTGEIVVSPISAVLMATFFIVYGVTAGVYTGTWFYGKRRLLSTILPAFIATAITVVMYIGEMMMMKWNLYRFGEGLVFDSIGACPLAPVDFAVILAAGVITYYVLLLIRPKKAHA